MDSRIIENLADVGFETWRACEDHFAAHGFQSTHVIEEPLLDQQFVGVKIHVCPPSDRHPFVAMFTSGMSDRQQNVPPEREDCRFSELVIFLPPDWPGGSGDAVAIEDARLSWVKQWLLRLARYPHATGNWVGPGHLFPTGDARPLPGTGFTAFVLLEPISLPWEIAGPHGRSIALHTVMPLYPEEVELKRRHGTTELLRQFAANHMNEIADPARQNVGTQ